MSEIKRLFGNLKAQELLDLFQGSVEGTEFDRYKRTYNIETRDAWFIIKHKPTGKLYGLAEYSLDSWDNGAISYEVDEIEIHELDEKYVRVRQHYSVTSETFAADWDW